MSAKWPNFDAIFLCDWGACWEGPVVSWEKEYIIRVWYVPTGEIGGCQMPTSLPDVYVVSQKLCYFHWETGQLLPHFNMRRRTPSLCCFDVSKGDWDATQAIADTIIFYSSDWLRLYELWRISGKWSGPETQCATIDMLGREVLPSYSNRRHDLRARENRRELNSIGLQTPTSVSFPLMAAASRESSLPLSWRDWRNYSLQTELSQITSTLSPGHQPAALLR